MLWSTHQTYTIEPFEREQDLEDSLEVVKRALFGAKRVYLETKKVIGRRGGVRNIPDAYLIDLTSKKVPALYVVENELARHDPPFISKSLVAG